MTTGVLLQYVQPQIVAASGQETFNHGFGAYLLIWTVFTAALTVGARYINVPALAAFALLKVVYLLAGIANLTTGDLSTTLTRIAGWVGLADGVAAWYLGIGILLNGVIGREIMPMAPYVAE